MDDFLSKVRQVKESEVALLKSRQSKNSFGALFMNAPHTVFIAEIKPKSPSEGALYAGDPVALARVYQDAGADAVSVLTDQTFFGGSMELLQQVRQVVQMPLLRKDFIIDRSQLVESVGHADAVLLIVRMLDEAKLTELIGFARELALVPLVEVASEEELAAALRSGAAIIGVNARDLGNPKDVNLDRAFAVLKKIPSEKTGLLFSGVYEPSDVARAVSYGARGVLVGTSLLKGTGGPEDIKHKVRSLKNYDK